MAEAVYVAGIGRMWLRLVVAGFGWLSGWLAWFVVRLTLHGNGFICDKLWLGCLVDWLFRYLVLWLFHLRWPCPVCLDPQ